MARLNFTIADMHIVQIPCFCKECAYSADISQKEDGLTWYCHKCKQYKMADDYCSRGSKKNKPSDN